MMPVHVVETSQPSTRNKNLLLAADWTFALLMLFVSAYELFLYDTSQNVTCEQDLRGWCVADGCLGLVYAVFSMASIFAKKNVSAQSYRQIQAVKFMLLLTALCLLIWLGSMFYAIDPDFHLCPDSLYLFAFWVLTIVYVLWGFVVLFAIVACFVMAFAG